jgi:hypothetical protein
MDATSLQDLKDEYRRSGARTGIKLDNDEIRRVVSLLPQQGYVSSTEDGDLVGAGGSGSVAGRGAKSRQQHHGTPGDVCGLPDVVVGCGSSGVRRSMGQVVHKGISRRRQTEASDKPEAVSYLAATHPAVRPSADAGHRQRSRTPSSTLASGAYSRRTSAFRVRLLWRVGQVGPCGPARAASAVLFPEPSSTSAVRRSKWTTTAG